jgi:peptide/nickel transport system permease protein
VVIGILVVVAIFAPLIAPHDPNAIDPLNSLRGSRPGYLLGQDGAGRDIFSRIIVGTRLSLVGPLIVVAMSTAAGTAMGLLAGYAGGFVDSVLARAWDVMFAFPPLLLAISIVAAFGAGFWTAVLAIALTYVALIARVVRGVVLVEREKAYVDASRLQGFTSARTAVRHVLPNVAPTIIAQATLNFGYSLLDLAGLSFLGLGVQPPQADWGTMLADGRQYILISPNQVLSASVAIAIAVVGFNVLGDSLVKRLSTAR